MDHSQGRLSPRAHAAIPPSVPPPPHPLSLFAHPFPPLFPSLSREGPSPFSPSSSPSPVLSLSHPFPRPFPGGPSP